MTDEFRTHGSESAIDDELMPAAVLPDARARARARARQAVDWLHAGGMLETSADALWRAYDMQPFVAILTPPAIDAAVPAGWVVEFAARILWADGQRRLKQGQSDLPRTRTDFRSAARALFDHPALTAAVPKSASDTGAGLREAEVERLMHVIDRDRYVVAHCMNEIERQIRGREWLTQSRGPYEWDDDRFYAEFADAIDAIRDAVKPLAVVAWDKRDCTRIEERVNAAKLAARNLLAKPIGSRTMIAADLFGDPRDAEISDLRARLAALATDATTLPADVRRLVIAARVVAFEDDDPEAKQELVAASEMFADRVPWQDEPASDAADVDALTGCADDQGLFAQPGMNDARDRATGEQP